MPKINSSFFSSFEDNEDDVEEKDLETTEEEDDDTTGADTSNDSEQQDEESDEVEPQEDEQEDSNEESEEGESDEDFFTSIINDQAEKGTLFYDEDKEYEGSGEEIFDEVITDTLNKRFQEEYVDKIPEEYQSLFTALKAGKSVTEWYENTQPIDYDKIDLSSEDTQKQMVRDHLKATGFDEEDIDDKLKDYEDAGTIEKNSKLAVKYFKKQEDKKAEKYELELEAQREQAEKQAEEDFKKFKSEVLATEELGKKKLTKQEREKLLDHITKPVNKKGESQLVVNQKSREKQLQMAYLDMIGFDFSKIEQKAETKAASGLRAKLSKTTDINAKKNGATTKSTTTSNKIVRGPWDSQ